jgi:hypothetical protein
MKFKIKLESGSNLDVSVLTVHVKETVKRPNPPNRAINLSLEHP